MTLIKELLDIPDRVQKGDFVLKLTEGVTDPQETLREYVVTPELVKCYDSALTFIKSAVQGRTSKATYLHGSFGSGKSHFMAVLHLILQGNLSARAIPELTAVIQKHNEWLAGKKFLLVPYHMIGAHDMESGVLGNYVDFMRRTHPDASTPPVYVSESIVRQAMDERASYGDEPFFKRLNAGRATGDSAWGDLEAPWDAESFERAASAAPDSEPHLLLVSALLKTVASSHAEVISQRGGNFVRFDKGLSLISQHAAKLGYHALILFLDELILWLANNATDLSFVRRESAKLTNLVEAQSAERPIPLISFVARQRDLRELVGDHVPGAEKLAFGDSLDWQQGRFDTITLEDRNLPAIAEKRVLKIRSDSARRELDAAFEQTLRMKDGVMNILLTQEGDKQMFRKLYPFSPALVQTLIAVSSVLQRERTALKVMMQLLVDQRDTLNVGEIIPVGDLFDVVAHGDEAFSPDMATHFENALRLYHQKLLPSLEKQHGRREDLEALPHADPKRTAFRNDDRLIKTLLLSALVPEVESLRGLNAEKLAALNHGTIKSPIPGREPQLVLARCQQWARDSGGQIRIGEESNPTLSVQISGVDVQSIIDQAMREDNQGNRIRRVRQMLFEQLSIGGEAEFEQFHEFLWKNTKRTCTVLFRNIRELPDASLENGSDDWKLIIDFPFDEAGHSPRDDLSKLQRYRQSRQQGTKTLCWVPSFFSPEAQKDLGRLVIVDHILTGERFAQYANHLSPQDRASAKSLLDDQRRVLRRAVQSHLDAAYGLDVAAAGSLDDSHHLEPHEHFASLHNGFTPQPPPAANLAAAMHHLLGQALEHEFPAAPAFETEIKPSVLKKVYELVLPAAQASDLRQAVDKTQRQLLRQVANPLLIGEMGEDATHFVLGQHWKSVLGKRASEAGGAVHVRQLREWIDQPKPMGLPKEAQNLIILLFAAQTNRSVYLHGGPNDNATLQNLPDDCELRTVELPPAEAWAVAVRRAGALFGLTPSPLLSANNVASLAAEIKPCVVRARKPCETFVKRLRERLAALNIPLDESDRLKTASATHSLLAGLHAVAEGPPRGAIAFLAEESAPVNDSAMAECLKKAPELDGNLDAANWDLIVGVGQLTGDRQAKGKAIVAEVQNALLQDEHVAPLATTLKSAQARATQLLFVKPPDPNAPSIISPPVTSPPPKGAQVVDSGRKDYLSVAATKEELQRINGVVKDGDVVKISLIWSVERKTP